MKIAKQVRGPSLANRRIMSNDQPTMTRDRTPASESEDGHGPAHQSVDGDGLPETSISHPSDEPTQPEPSRTHPVVRTAARGLVAVVILGAGIFAAVWFNRTEGQAQTGGGGGQEAARLVETLTVHRQTTHVTLRAMGTVMPARKLVVRPRVSGKIIDQAPAFVPGGVFNAGEEMVRIDRSDYEYALAQRQSELEDARATQQIEQGDQTVAEEELKLLEGDIANMDRDLILRKPQARQAQAAVDSAQAAVNQAKLNLKRTRIEAPFDGQIVSRSVTAGNNVSQGEQLATFVGSKHYWIEASVPAAHIRWIDIPQKPGATGSPVRITNESAWGPEASRLGHVTHLIGQLEDQTRMAQIMIRVDDPLALEQGNEQKPELMLGAFVDLRIRGQQLEDVAIINRDYVRENGQVWVMNDSDQLETRDVRVSFRGKTRAYIKRGLRSGDRVVTTNLASPVEGMQLRTTEESKS